MSWYFWIKQKPMLLSTNLITDVPTFLNKAQILESSFNQQISIEYHLHFSSMSQMEAFNIIRESCQTVMEERPTKWQRGKSGNIYINMIDFLSTFIEKPATGLCLIKSFFGTKSVKNQRPKFLFLLFSIFHKSFYATLEYSPVEESTSNDSREQ